MNYSTKTIGSDTQSKLDALNLSDEDRKLVEIITQDFESKLSTVSKEKNEEIGALTKRMEKLQKNDKLNKLLLLLFGGSSVLLLTAFLCWPNTNRQKSDGQDEIAANSGQATAAVTVPPKFSPEESFLKNFDYKKLSDTNSRKDFYAKLKEYLNNNPGKAKEIFAFLIGELKSEKIKLSTETSAELKKMMRENKIDNADQMAINDVTEPEKPKTIKKKSGTATPTTTPPPEINKKNEKKGSGAVTGVDERGN
jgi:hypothetical protein